MRRKQIYDKAWQKLARRFLKKNRRCRFCGANAVAVDHVTPTRVAPERRLDPTNLQALCWRCHNRITTAYEKGSLAGACDPDGSPVDPWHPWNQADNAAAIAVANVPADKRLVAREIAAEQKRLISRRK